MTRGEALGAALVTLLIVVAPGLAEMLGTAVVGPTTPATSPPGEGEAPIVPTWRDQPDRADRSRTVPGVNADRSPAKRALDAAPYRLGVAAPGTVLNWHALALCESSDNPQAVSPSGKYRGAFQMDAAFWRTYGGLRYAARPDLASYTEQLVVAKRGYAARGRSPWPYCGRRLTA